MRIKCSVCKEGTPNPNEPLNYADAKLLKYKALTATLLEKLSKSIQTEAELESKIYQLESQLNVKTREVYLSGTISAYENILDKFIKNK